MHSSTLLRIFFAIIFMFSLQANAAATAQVYTGTGSTCPDGSKFYTYLGFKVCKSRAANITWTIPNTRMNGSALPVSEIKGYEIYWTRTSDNSTGTITIASNTQTTATFQTLYPSMYYFAMSAIDINGVKSPLSQMVQIQM